MAEWNIDLRIRLYVVPKTNDRVVIPFHRCALTIEPVVAVQAMLKTVRITADENSASGTDNGTGPLFISFTRETPNIRPHFA
jgi:hypothetical protein